MFGLTVTSGHVHAAPGVLTLHTLQAAADATGAGPHRGHQMPVPVAIWRVSQ